MEEILAAPNSVLAIMTSFGTFCKPFKVKVVMLEGVKTGQTLSFIGDTELKLIDSASNIDYDSLVKDIDADKLHTIDRRLLYDTKKKQNGFQPSDEEKRYRCDFLEWRSQMLFASHDAAGTQLPADIMKVMHDSFDSFSDIAADKTQEMSWNEPGIMLSGDPRVKTNTHEISSLHSLRGNEVQEQDGAMTQGSESQVEDDQMKGRKCIRMTHEEVRSGGGVIGRQNDFMSWNMNALETTKRLKLGIKERQPL